MTKAILFDFWGTLVETGVQSPTKQVRNILRIYMPFSDYVINLERAMMTKQFASLNDAFVAVCKTFNVRYDRDLIERLIGMWNKSWMLAHPYDDVDMVLGELSKKYDLYLVSNTDCFSVPNVLGKFALDKYFKKKYLSCEVGMIKTDEAFMQKILEENNLKPEECVFVGDSVQSDMMAAHAAGMNAVLIDRKEGRDFKLKIKSLKELESLLPI